MIESAQVESPRSEALATGTQRKPEGATRLISLDAFRGLVMILMLGRRCAVYSGTGISTQCGVELDRLQHPHVEWQGAHCMT